MTTQRVLAIHDLCSFGRCSLTAAIPVISAMGLQVCPFPTALFSNNLTFGEFTFSDFTPKMTDFMEKWQKLGFSYDAIYSGFLGSAEQIAVVLEAIRRFGGDDVLVVVDPAMADYGKLYPIFGPEFVAEMRKLVAKATVITPNFTEACLLLDVPYEEGAPSKEKLRGMCARFAALGARKVVMTSVPSGESEIKVASFDADTGRYAECVTPRIPFMTCGTGDLFTSVLTGAMLKGAPLDEAAEKATRFVSLAMEYTHRSGSDPREGVQVEPCLKHLMD